MQRQIPIATAVSMCWFFLMPSGLSVLAGVAATASPVGVVQPAVRFGTGDRVEVEFLGEWRAGRVIEVNGDWYTVRFEHRGEEIERRRHMRRLRAIGGGGGPAVEPETREQDEEGDDRVGGDRASDLVITPIADSGALTVGPEFGAAEWVFAPAADAADRMFGPPAARVPLRHAMTSFFGRVGSMHAVVDGDEASLLIEHYDGKPGGERAVRVERVDPRTLDSLGVVDGPSGGTLMDVSADGRLFAFASADGRSPRHDTVHVMRRDGDVLSHVVSLKPFGDERSNNVESVAIIGDGLLLTRGRKTCVVWQLPECRAVWRCATSGISAPLVVEGAGAVVVPLAEAWVVCDAGTGRVLGRLPEPFVPSRQMAVSASGALFAQVVRGSLVVMRGVPRPSIVLDVGLPTKVAGRTIEFVGAGTLLIDGVYLFDVASGRLTGELAVDRRVSMLVALGSVWGAANDRVGAEKSAWVRGVGLPRPGGAAPLLLTAGDAITLDVEAPDRGEVARITGMLHASAKAAGLQIASSAGHRLEFRSEPAGTEKRRYTSVRDRSQRSVVVHRTAWRVSIVDGDRTIWTYGRTVDDMDMTIRSDGREFDPDANRRTLSESIGGVRLPRRVLDLGGWPMIEVGGLE